MVIVPLSVKPSCLVSTKYLHVKYFTVIIQESTKLSYLADLYLSELLIDNGKEFEMICENITIFKKYEMKDEEDSAQIFQQIQRTMWCFVNQIFVIISMTQYIISCRTYKSKGK